MSIDPLVTIAVPSYNQGRFLEQALASIFQQTVPVEVFVLDGGSRDESQEVIDRWNCRLAGWRSHPDAGQATAVNEGIDLGRAPYVCWLNSDDWFLPGGLDRLVEALEIEPSAPMVYGRTYNYREHDGYLTNTMVFSFSPWLMARKCIISQPGTLVRRACWKALGGLDPKLHMAMDYDLWWRVYLQFGMPLFIDDVVAVNRLHSQSKTSQQRRLNYQEVIAILRRHRGRVPLKWWLARPYTIWYRDFVSHFKSR